MSKLSDKLDELDFEVVTKVQNNPIGFDGAILISRLKLKEEAKAEVCKYLLGEVLALIGTNESPSINSRGTNVSAVRNSLRRELRSKARDMWGNNV